METLTFIIDSNNKKYNNETFNSLSFDIPFSRYFRDPDQMYKLRSEFISTTESNSDTCKIFVEVAGLTNYNKYDSRENKGNTLLLGVGKPVFIGFESSSGDKIYYHYTTNESICHKLISPQVDTIQVKLYTIQNSTLSDLGYQLILHFDPC